MFPLLSYFNLLLICSSGLVASASEMALTVDPDRVLNRIDPKIDRHFLEHIYHSCNGGLWGDLIWDRSFEGGGAGVAWTMQVAARCSVGWLLGFSPAS